MSIKPQIPKTIIELNSITDPIEFGGFLILLGKTTNEEVRNAKNLRSVYYDFFTKPFKLSEFSIRVLQEKVEDEHRNGRLYPPTVEKYLDSLRWIHPWLSQQDIADTIKEIDYLRRKFIPKNALGEEFKFELSRFLREKAEESENATSQAFDNEVEDLAYRAFRELTLVSR